MAKSLSFDDLEDATPVKKSTELSFDDLEDAAPKVEKIEPFKHVLSGAGKTFTLLPLVPGLVGSAGEALTNLYTKDKDVPYAPEMPDREQPSFTDRFKREFGKAAEEGVDKKLVDVGLNLTKKWTDALDVPMFPKRTANQIGDLIGGFALPVPGAMLPSLVGKGALNKLGRAATFVSPAVRITGLNKPSATRLGTSLGIGTAIEQGTRALVDDPEFPLMFSEQALTGKDPKTDISFDELQDATLDESVAKAEAMESTTSGDLITSPYYDPKLAAQDQAQQEAQDDSDLKFWGLLLGATLTGIGAAKYRSALRKVATPERPFGTDEPRVSGQLSDAIDVVKATPSGGRFGIGNKVNVGKALVHNRLRRIYGTQVDADVILVQQLKSKDVPQHIIENLRGQGRVDSVGQLTTLFQHGIMPNGEQLPTNLRALVQQYDRWEVPRQSKFLEYIAAIQEDIVRTKATADDFIKNLDEKELFETLSKTDKVKATKIRQAARGFSVLEEKDRAGNVISREVKPLQFGVLEQRMRDYQLIVSSVRGSDKRVEVGLLKKAVEGKKPQPTLDSELRAAIKSGDADSEFKAMFKSLTEQNSPVLKDAVTRGVQSKEFVDHTIKNFSRGDELLYIPSQNTPTTARFFTRLGMKLGLGTREGKTLRTVGNLQKKAFDEKAGVNAPMDPFSTTASAMAAILEHTNRSVAQMNVMKKVLNLDVDPSTGFAKYDDKGFLIPKIDDAAFTASRDKLFFHKTPTYVGKISPTDKENVFNALNLKFYDDKVAKNLEAFKKDLGSLDPGTAQNAVHQIGLLEDSLIIQHRGDYHIFGNMDKAFKMAIEFDTSLIDNIAVFNNFFKRTMTIGTTGRYSTFSPIAFVYNASIGSVNAALVARGGMLGATRDAINVWRDGIKGAVDVMVTKMADDFVQMIDHTIQTGTGIGNTSPKTLNAIKGKLRNRVKRSMMHDFTSKTGSIGAASQNTDEFLTSVSSNMSGSVFHISDKYGGNILPQFVRTWDHLNAGFHEGTAYGMALRKLGGTTKGKSAKEIRTVKRQVADLVGNNKLQGASKMARHLNALIPFYGPMLQGLTTLGRSVHRAGKAKTVMRLTAFVGTPVLLEATYASWIDGDQIYTDASGKKWTQNSYFWKGYTAAQRASNMIVPKPGQPPWNAAVFPVIPEIAAIRSLYFDAYELLFGLSEIPGISNAAIGKEEAFSADHISAALARFANVSLPPHIKAALSGFGLDVRAGLSVEGADGVSIIQTRSLPAANRQTPNLEQTRYEGSEFGVRFQAIVQDLGGAIATHAIKSYEALFSGDDSTPLKERLVAVRDTFGQSLFSSSKIPSALFTGRVLSQTTNPEISAQLFKKEEALNHFVEVNKQLTTGNRMAGRFPKQGVSSTMTTDPITIALAGSANIYIQQVKPFKTYIAFHQTQINSLSTSLTNTFDYPGSSIPKGKITVAQRNELIAAHRSQIGVHKATILGMFKAFEEKFAHDMSLRLGRPLDGFTFDNWKTRSPNPSGSVSPELPNLPQTSE